MIARQLAGRPARLGQCLRPGLTRPRELVISAPRTGSLGGLAQRRFRQLTMVSRTRCAWWLS